MMKTVGLTALLAATLMAANARADKTPSPAELGAKMAEQLFRTKPEVYKPIGCDTERPWYGGGKMMYCVVATWVNALEMARVTGNKALMNELLDIYPRIVQPETKAVPLADCVDNTLFGALPLEVGMLSGNKEALALGFKFADAQWTMSYSAVNKNWATPPEAELKKLIAAGYSPQTRLWIDDMYMITALQVQAARAAKGKDRMKYLDRAAREMHLYIEQLQRDDGLFMHSHDVPIAWGRGNGWMAGGMTLLLCELPDSHPERGYILAAYRRFAEALETYQRPNGLWGQIVDDPESWDESSASAMFAYMFAKGMNRYLIEWGYLGKAKKAYEALAAKVDQHGNIADVCEGTNAKNDREHYLKRPRVNGAPYGQAAMELLCTALHEESLAKPRKAKYKQLTPMERAAAGVVAKPGEFRLESTYENISVSWGAPREFKNGVRMEYRKSGESAWREALAPLFFSPNRNYRGSIVKLEEDTVYEVRMLADGKEAVKGEVRTWATKVPIAETVEIDPAAAEFPIRIDRKGKADGWIRYVPKDGKTLVNGKYEQTFVIKGAAYVILDGFTIVGGKSGGSISIDDSKGVRILNCELSGWGPGGPPQWGKQRGLCFENGNNVQNGAIRLGSGVSEVTIERCFIHSPRGRAHSWRYSHPYGPEAVQVHRPSSTVIRWCDFVGCDSRRYEDCVKCAGNGGFDTGLNRNSDVCGCFLFGANDDCIELDGGQQNVRCYRNRFEEGLMGVSVQFNQTSPSYVFENAFTGLGTEFGNKVSSVKTSSIDGFHYGSASFVINNTMCGPGSANGGLDFSSNCWTARLNVFNNLFVGEGQELIGTNEVHNGKLGGNVVTADTSCLKDVAGADVACAKPVKCPRIPNFCDGPDPIAGALQPGDAPLPWRPLPWTLSTGRIGVKAEKGRLSRESAAFRLSCPASAAGYKAHFRVRTTDLDHEWFEVTPAEGVIEAGKDIDFTVRFDASKLNRRRAYAAAVLVRTDDGLSRPVSLHAETDFVGPFKVEKPRDVVVYGKQGVDLEAPEGAWTFEIPKKGTYYLFVRGYNPKSEGNSFMPPENSLVAVIEGVKRPAAFPQLKKWPTWAPVNPAVYNITGFELDAGEHTVEIAESAKGLVIQGLAFALEPLDMEGEKRNDVIQ